MKSNAQSRAQLRYLANSARRYPIEMQELNPNLVVQVLEDFTELYHERNALRKEKAKLIKRLEKIKGLTEV